MLTSDEIVDGYIGARERSGAFHSGPYVYPEDFHGAETLGFNASCPEGLSSSKNHLRIGRWKEALPCIAAKHLVLAGPRLTQEIFDAATQVKGLEILVVYQSSVENIESISNASALIGARLKSSKSISSYSPLGQLPNLTSLTLDNPKGLSTLDFMTSLSSIQDFSIFHRPDSWLVVDNLLPLQGLQQLQRICLSGVKISKGGLLPLHGLPKLENALLSYVFTAGEFADFRASTPTLRQGSPFRVDLTAEFCAG
ncbi:hypothetical protein [Xanthomonas campestris]|uniref:hypothetical protein n=1 Tax=Xanthomonas campestris TaxID=339 RepID=UPI00129015E4|nr:hypothetical protein [Xanthomonas campestris]